jgi:hypothetical protein
MPFGSLKDLHSNCQRSVSVNGEQLNIGSFMNLVKRVEVFLAAECACERLFVNSAASRRIARANTDCLIVDLLVIQTKIIWSNHAHVQKCADILRDGQSGAG